MNLPTLRAAFYSKLKHPLGSIEIVMTKYETNSVYVMSIYLSKPDQLPGTSSNQEEV